MNPYVYLHEIVRTVPGREEPYLASVLSLQHDPTRGERRQHPVFAQFRSIQTSVPPRRCVVAQHLYAVGLRQQAGGSVMKNSGTYLNQSSLH